MSKHKHFEVGAILGMFMMSQMHVFSAATLLLVGHLIAPDIFLGPVTMSIYILIGVPAHIKMFSIMDNTKDEYYVEKILSEAKGPGVESNMGAMKQGIWWRVKHETKYMAEFASLSFLNKKTS